MKGKSSAAAANPATDHLVGVLRDTIVALVRRDGPDLSARQLGVFLTCYLHEGAHTVRGLAVDLGSGSGSLLPGWKSKKCRRPARHPAQGASTAR